MSNPHDEQTRINDEFEAYMREERARQIFIGWCVMIAIMTAVVVFVWSVEQ